MRQLSQTELIALANIWKFQPCTAYHIRREITRSPVQNISASAGTIYPVIERLVELRLVSTRAKLSGKRAATMLACTKSGVKALRTWLFTLDAKANFPTDPMRTKAVFLGLLDAAERRDWIAGAKQSLIEQAALLAAFEETTRPDDQDLKAAHINSRLTLEARRRWLALMDT